MKIELLLTGNELMSGDTVDSNSARIAKALLPLGLRIKRRITVGDYFDYLVEDMDTLASRSDVVIMNGGLGPTKDDLTAVALAKLLDVPIVEHPEAMAHLSSWCDKRGLVMNDANKKQAMLPQGAEILRNRIGSAVGFVCRYKGCDIMCTPGVPSELECMLEDEIVPRLKSLTGENELNLTRLQTFGLGESRVQQMITDHFTDWPEAIDLGFRAGMPFLEIKLISHGKQHQQLHEDTKSQLSALLGGHIVGENDLDLATTVVDLLRDQGSSITVAESCTGGLIASMLTRVAGASQVFEAGFVTYSNAIKSSLLGVDSKLIETEGAVSEDVVKAMVLGAIERSNADYGIAVSGIAGPDGGSDEKPVGTVWIAWGKEDAVKTICLRFNFGRQFFQNITAATCLDLMRRELLGIADEPNYLRERSGAVKPKHS